MGCTSKGKSFFSSLEIHKISEDSIICGNVLFWDNGKSLIVTSGHLCQMYSVSSGELIKVLFGCKSKIISCKFCLQNTDRLIALSEGGEIVKYDLAIKKVKYSRKLKFNASKLNALKVPKFSVDKKFYTKGDSDPNYTWTDEELNNPERRIFLYGELVCAEKFPGTLIWTSWSMTDEFQSHISIFCCKTGKQFEKCRIPKTAFQKRYKNFTVCKTLDKNILFIGMGINFVHVCHYRDGGLYVFSQQLHLLGDEVEVTCLTFHPKECAFATGDSRGVIVVWKNILEKHPLKSTHAWHTVEIRDIAFSEEGVHLFSGGDENVLVKWSFLSNQKNFLPRLSSPICHVTVAEDSSSLVAVSLADNEIYIIDSNFQKVSVIKKYSIYIPPGAKKCYSILTNDPKNNHLVLNGRPGHLQFLSNDKCYKHLYSLDVCKTNFMTGDKYLVNLEVTHAKFSKNGSWLVTAEARVDKFFKESRLKFWQFDEAKQMFTLNTNMELPHDENDIHSLEISSDDLVATTGSDKQFKLWAPFEMSDANVMKTVWSVLSAGKYKLLPCDPIDFCKDATLVAVGFGPSLTLWSTNSCTLKCSLITPFKRDRLKSVKFGSEEHSHLIVAATDHNLTAWNIITLTTIWTVDLEVSFLVGDFFKNYMCAFSKNKTLYVFNSATTSPDLVLKNVSQSEIVAAHSGFSINDECNQFQLYFLNSERELFCLKSKEDLKDDEIMNDSDAFVTPFSIQVAEKSGGSITKSVSDYIPVKSKKNLHYISSVLDAPAHTLPNPLRFCSHFLENLTLSIQKPVKVAGGKDKLPVNDDIIKTVNETDASKNCVDVVTEESLWVTVNKLFEK